MKYEKSEGKYITISSNENKKRCIKNLLKIDRWSSLQEKLSSTVALTLASAYNPHPVSPLRVISFRSRALHHATPLP